MNILDQIVQYKKEVVGQKKREVPLSGLFDSPFYHRSSISYVQHVRNNAGNGIISEFKRRSPSKGWINQAADANKVIPAYEQAGASALSILTDNHFFGGSEKDILDVRSHIQIPILRKEFIIDTYQIHESKSIGADIILLIAAILEKKQVVDFSQMAHELGLEVILEIHDEHELDHYCNEVAMVGINNRNLKSFDVDVDRSMRMINALPAEAFKIAESGITEPDQLKRFRECGFEGFLIGERFMRSSDPGYELQKFIQQTRVQ